MVVARASYQSVTRFGRVQDLAACGDRVAVRLAAVASPEVQYRVSLEAQSDDPGDQSGHIGEREPFRAALGQERAERVIEPTRCRGGPDRVVGRNGESGGARVTVAP